MVGIKSFGAYVPWLRLSRELIARGWGIPGAPGTLAVANFDEDSVTMAVEAALGCLAGFDPASLGGVYFASTTAPYAEKSLATLIATVLDAPPPVFTADFATSLRASTSALEAALDAVACGKADNVMVTSGETRVGEPVTSWEQTLGDGAGAVLVGEGDGVIAEYLGAVAVKDEIMLTWRREEHDHVVRDYNPRMAQSFGYEKAMVKAIKAAMEKFGLTPDTIARAVYTAPEFRSHGRITAKCGFDAASGQVQDALFAFVGGTGAAQPLMMLAGALESGLKEGDIILLAHYADGADVLVFKVTAAIDALPARRALSAYLAARQPLESYARFMRYKGLTGILPYDDFGSPIQMWRDLSQVYPLHGVKCNQCGMVRFPIDRVCARCKARDDNTELALVKRGKVFSFIHDNLYASPEPPTTLTIVDLDEGGRVFLQMTDRNVDEVEVDMEVDLTFRKIHDGNDINNYFWKCRPARQGGV
jgi:hydroxymethylglutaryl-CoA synthase